MSEFLKRCRELADKDTTNVATINRTIHTSPGYIRLLDYAERLEQELNEANRLSNDRFNTIQTGLKQYLNVKKDLIKKCNELDELNGKVNTMLEMIDAELNKHGY